MTEKDMEQAREELAFMKSVVADHNPSLRTMAIIYGLAGIIYGTQCLLHLVEVAGLISWPDMVRLVIASLPTVIFLVMITGVSIRHKRKHPTKGTAARAIDSAFTGVGLANVAMIPVFGLAAWERGDISVWLFFPAVVCAFQGAGWYAASAILRVNWMKLAAVGWYVAAIGLGLTVQDPGFYLLLITLAMYLLMCVPGYILYRQHPE